MSDTITADELVATDFDEIEYAYVRLAKGDPTEYEAGRIISCFQSDIRLAYRGHTTEVTNADTWDVVEYEPVTSDLERMQIENELDQ